MANKWQRAYNFIRGWKAPKSLKAIIKVAWLIVKRYPHIGKIAMQAFAVSKLVEGQTMSGLLKEGKVIEEITKGTAMFGYELPTVVTNWVNETCAMVAKLGVGSKESK